MNVKKKSAFHLICIICGANPALFLGSTGSYFVRCKAAGELIFIHFHTVLRLRMSEATQLLPICLRVARRNDYTLLWLIHSLELIRRKVVVTFWPNSRF